SSCPLREIRRLTRYRYLIETVGVGKDRRFSIKGISLRLNAQTRIQRRFPVNDLPGVRCQSSDDGSQRRLSAVLGISKLVLSLRNSGKQFVVLRLIRVVFLLHVESIQRLASELYLTS